MNAPANFQRFMERCLGDLRDKVAITYLDNIIVFSRTFEAHVEHLREVLRKLRQHGVKLKPRKCSLICLNVRFVFLGGSSLVMVTGWPLKVLRPLKN